MPETSGIEEILMHLGTTPSRLIRALVCAAMAAGVSAVALPTPAFAANYAACSSGQTPSTGSYKWYWRYDATPTPYWVKGVIGDATIRPVYGCSPDGFTAVTVDNLQQYYSGPNIVQLAYASHTDGVPYLYFTPSDTAGGAVAVATWYNGNGQLTVGDYYRFDIYINSANQWTFCIKDVTKGQGYTCGYRVDNHWGTPGGNLAWWGYEDFNSHSSLGPISGSGNVDVHWMQWLTNQSGAQWMVENTVQCLNESNPGAVIPYWCTHLNTAPGYGQDTLRAWTTGL